MSTVAVFQALTLPPAELGPALLSIREDQWFDRKSRRVEARALADLLIGFANADGGLVVVGLSDGQIEGVDDHVQRVCAWQQAALDFISPTAVCRSRLVECVNSRDRQDHLLVIEVEPGQQVHVNRRDEVFLRVGDENRKLSFAQRQELLFDKGQATYESVVLDATQADLDEDLLDTYAAAVGHPEPVRLLAARGLATAKGALTVGAALLFAEHPQRWLPEASVRVLRYHGSERGTGARQRLVEDVRIDGPIPHQLSAARSAVAELLPSRQALTTQGRFGRIGLVPEDAWLEGLVNAVVHRSYSISGDHIRIEIFDDRMEIESPGRFPGIAAAPDPLRITRFARNPRIARVCADLRFGQELGEGIRRMFEEMRLAGLADPDYRQTSSSTRVTLSYTPVDRALEAQLPAGARDLLGTLRAARRLSTGELVESSGRSRPVVLRQLRAMEDAGLIRWVGHSRKDPRAYWELPVP